MAGSRALFNAPPNAHDGDPTVLRELNRHALGKHNPIAFFSLTAAIMH